jgi:hypothetical protein
LTWGARLSDVNELDPINVFRVNNGQTQRVSATFVEGKTVPTTGAFTLHMPWELPAATILWRAAVAAREAGASKIFLNNVTEIHDVIGKCDVRALRRSGLMRLAEAGASVETLRTFSRHTTNRMLEVYLNHGLFNREVATNQISALWATHHAGPAEMVDSRGKITRLW